MRAEDDLKASNDTRSRHELVYEQGVIYKMRWQGLKEVSLLTLIGFAGLNFHKEDFACILLVVVVVRSVGHTTHHISPRNESRLPVRTTHGVLVTLSNSLSEALELSS